ncbi:glycosyltransferase family 2 protein [Lutimaribacter saemankumensis]|nr:glycosyltransferase family A protein [Lutimaribacter saemankumensis]
MHSLPVAQSENALIDVVSSALGPFSQTDWFVCGKKPGISRGEFFKDAHPHPIARSQTFVLWSDTRGNAEWIRKLGASLSKCALLYMQVYEKEVVDLVDAVLSHGLEPVLRDEGGKAGFHILFLRKRDIENGTFDQLPVWVRSAVDCRSSMNSKQAAIPALIPCFNNQTYCRSMISQLRNHGFADITLLDNASTSPEMHSFLDEVSGQVTVRRLEENLGPKKCLFAPGVYENLPRYFCVTDPDIVFNPYLPSNFVHQMIDLTKRYRVGKVGFALDISHRQFFREITVKLLYRDWSTAEWEERFWSRSIGQTKTRDRIFDAPVDTTFAVYDKEKWSQDNFTAGLRVSGRYTATHAPWYDDQSVPSSERERYSRESTASFYRM